jgi:hypothetical protein
MRVEKRLLVEDIPIIISMEKVGKMCPLIMFTLEL